LLCGAVRLARFNVQTVSPKADKRYFVGVPIPAGAGFVAASVHLDTEPLRAMALSIGWLCLLVVVGLLMVSTWRYPSIKQLNFSKPRTPLLVLVVGGLIFVISQWSQPVLMGIAASYLLSGLVIRLIRLRRKRDTDSTEQIAEQQIG
jgi:CDP-diacylglycerol--serine O-phosphatidyltransferase